MARPRDTPGPPSKPESPAQSPLAGAPSAALDDARTGVVIVDHGSRRSASNHMLEGFVADFARQSSHAIVEPAHMELAQPSIATAFDRCVRRGAGHVVVCPYFLLPGRHWDQDIPQLTEAAAAKHPGVSYLVTAPIGLHPMMGQVIESRIDHCLAHVAGEAKACESCRGTGRCRVKTAPPAAADPASA